MRSPIRCHGRPVAFTLIEVMLALGICTFAIVGLIGLFGTGLQASRDSEDQIEASDLASLLVSTRVASPAGDIQDFAIPATAMTGVYGNAFPSDSVYIGVDGKKTTVTTGAYRLTCKAGTDAATTGPGVCKLYLMLSWPPQADPANPSTKRYEVLTYIPLP